MEKFLLTTIGYISFNILIPLACVLLGVYLFSSKEVLRTLAVKLAVFALAAFTIVPASVKATKLIEQTFETSISETYDTVDEISGEADVDSLCAAANCGVVMLATAHASSVADCERRPFLKRLKNCGVFERAVVIERELGKRIYRVEVLR